MPSSCANIEDFMAASGGSTVEPANCANMRLGKIAYMDKIADAGTIRCGIIHTMQCQLWAEAEDSIACKGDEMSLGSVRLTNLSIRIRSRCIEIAQRDTP